MKIRLLNSPFKLEICQSLLKIYSNTKLILKMFPNTCKILPLGQNFAKSGHTDNGPKTFLCKRPSGQNLSKRFTRYFMAFVSPSLLSLFGGERNS